MPRLPRDVSGNDLLKKLRKYDYSLDRQKGSHLRLISTYKDRTHKITIPAHQAIKIGTLNNILNDIATYLGLSKEKLIQELFC